VNPEIKCARCPMCGGPPDKDLATVIGPWQWFCPNPDCDAFNWNATQTLDWNLTHATVHRMPDWLGGGE